jgi:excisionase family DNA binding protein
VSVNGAGGHSGISLAIPEPVLERIAERAAEIIAARQELDRREPEPWIGVEEAAKHLACPKGRIYTLTSTKRIPFARDGSRLLFKRSELDAWLENGGARRP